MIPLRRVFRVLNGGTPPPDEGYWGGSVCWVTPEDLGALVGREITQSRRTLTDRGLKAAARLAPEGSVVLSTRAPIGHAALAGRPLAFNQGCRALVPYNRTAIDPRFVLYQLQARREELESLGQGTTFLELSADRLATFQLHLPDLQVQRDIADRLDAECEQIDVLLDARERLLALLAERRRAVLFGCVSGRLTHASPRRERPVPWLDSAPEHWLPIKLTFVARLGSGHTPSRSRPELWEDCVVPWITTGEVAQLRDDRREVITTTRERISHAGVAASAAVIHPAETVVLCRTAASAGYSGLMGGEMATSQDFATWTCGPRLLPRFLLFCLRAMRPDLLGRLAMGSTHRTIYMPDIETLRIPLPTLEEQREALNVADAHLAVIDPLVEAVVEQIRLLKERRHALVHTAVMTAGAPRPQTVLA
jgi:type I restriction enzyme, S subunit